MTLLTRPARTSEVGLRKLRMSRSASGFTLSDLKTV